MKLKDCLIAWNPNSNEVKVGRLLQEGEADWTYPYLMTGGAAYVEVRDIPDLDARLRVMSDFIGLVVRDGVCPKSAHREFMKIEEYRKSIPVDLEADNCASF